MEARRKGRRVILLVTCIALCAVLIFSGLNFLGPISAESIYEHVEENTPDVTDENEIEPHEEPYRRFDEKYDLMDDRFGIWDKTTSFEKAIPQRNEVIPLLDELLPMGDYEVREPIRIDSDENFTEQADTEGWPGNGTEGNPYIIEGYEIDGNGHGYCIFIGNTTVHFELKDNYLHNASGKSSVKYFRDAGIYLRNVRNALIDGNTALNNGQKGIYLSSSSNTVINNTVTGSRFGIEIRSSGNIIFNNTVYDNSRGISIERSNNYVSGNTAYSNSRGIAIGGSGHTITNNTLYNNRHGIWFWYSSNNRISNNTLSNDNEEGIRLFVSHGNIVKDNIISNNLRALFLWYSNNNILSNNTVSGCGLAVLLRESDNNALSKNTLSNNDYGIILDFSTNQTLSGNTMENSGLFIDGNTLHQWNTHIIDTSNTVNGKPVYYWKDRTGGTVPADAGHVILASCTNILVENFIFNNSDVGIQLGFSNNNHIINNTATHNGYDGITLYRSHNNYIADNTLSNNGWMGLFLWWSEENTVLRNTVSNNGDHGILIWGWSDDNTFTDNTVSNSRRMGFYLSTSNGNNITNNHIFSNNGGGILIHSSDKNTIINNFLEKEGLLLEVNESESRNTHIIYTSSTANGKPYYYCKDRISGVVCEVTGRFILADYMGREKRSRGICNLVTGIYIYFSDENIFTNNTVSNYYYGVHLKRSNANLIYRNKFVENEFQAIDDGKNYWDYGDPQLGGKGGNYWSDYEGNDRGDGIGDVPYNVYGVGNKDNYPWVNPQMIIIEIVYIEIEPENSTVAAGNTQTFSAIAYDIHHNLIGEMGNFSEFRWSIEAEAGGSWYRNIYTSEYAGTWTVTGTYGTITDTAIITVNPGDAGHIVISPEKSNIKAGNSRTFNVIAYDEFGNQYDVTDETTWSIETDAGGVWEDNVYTSESAGTWTVTATYNGLTDDATLIVEPEGNVYYLKIRPETTYTKAGDSITYTAVSYDQYWNEIDEVTDQTNWSIGEDGTIYIGSNDGKLYAVGWPAPLISDENPSDGATDVSVTTQLSVYIDGITYPSEVGFYLEDELVHSETLDSDGVVETEILTLDYNTTYHWEIVVEDEKGMITNETYSFTTVEPQILTIHAEEGGTTVPAPGTYNHTYGDTITIEAIPDEGWRFSHWEGDYEGTEEEITITMDGHKSITAYFEKREHRLTISIQGDGSTVPGEGVRTYERGENVTVDATPDEGWLFSHWSGDVPENESDELSITIVMDGDKNITAHFHEILYLSIEIISPEYDRVFDSGDVTAEWRSEEGTYPISHHEIRLNDGDWVNIGTATAHTFTVTEPGDHVISVRVFDVEGNSDVDSTRFAIEESSPGSYWWLILLLIIVVVAIISVMNRGKGEDKGEESFDEEDTSEIEEDTVGDEEV